LWSRRIGGAGIESLYDMAVTADGSVLVAGTFEGTVDLGGATLISAGGADIFLVRYAADGTLLDARRFGDTGDEAYVALAVNGAGNALLAGRCDQGSIDLGDGPLGCGNGASFLVELEPDGDPVWKHEPSASAGLATSLAVAPNGDILQVGMCSFGCDFGGGPLAGPDLDIFLARYDGAGAHVWSKRFADANVAQYPLRVAVGPAGTVAIAGWFSVSGTGSTIDFGGGQLTVQGANFSDGDAFVAQFDAAGNHVWSKALGNLEASYANALGIAGNGDVVVGGIFQGAIDFGAGAVDPAGPRNAYVVRYDASGSHVWTHTSLGGGAVARDMAIGEGGVIRVAGGFSATVGFGSGPLVAAGDEDAYLVALDPAGQALGSRRFGDGCGQSATQVEVAPGIGTVVAGRLEEAGTTIDLGNGPLIGAGEEDVFVALLPP
jgi:hypothetical protein